MIRSIKNAIFKKDVDDSFPDKDKIIDIVDCIIISLNRKGDVTYINDRGCEILGCTREKILGKNWFKHFLTKDYRKNVYKVFKDLINERIEPVRRFENPILTKNGERIISWNNTYIKDDKDKVIRIIAAGLDMTEEHRAKEELNESNRKYKTYVENAEDILYSIDDKGTLTYISPNVSKFGYNDSEVIGKNIKHFIHKDDLDHVMKNLKENLQKNKKQITAFRLKTKRNHYIDVEETGNPIYKDKRNVGLIGSIRDVTAKKKMEDELARSKKELEDKVRNLERFNKLAVHRELKMIELKKEIKNLKERI